MLCLDHLKAVVLENEVGTEIRVISACLHLLTVNDKFSDDLHIYPITEKRILLN